MVHKPITLKNLSLELPHKTCFAEFSTIINNGNHIAIIGRNGSGKSSLLKLIKNIASDIIVGYVPQIIEEFNDLSGGQRFNAALTEALNLDPDILLLDEPTNHLDLKNRRSLMRSLKSFSGTLIIVSHDTQLLRNSIEKFWHIDNGKINIFSGNYDDYIGDIKAKRNSMEIELARLDRQKKDIHQSLMQEQLRAAKSKQKGQKSIDQRKWPTITGYAKAMKAQETTGNKKSAIDHKKQDLLGKLDSLRLPEVIMPKFSLNADDIGDKSVVSIKDASVGYADPILQNINLEMNSKGRIAIRGNNGSGKTTLIKAILNDPSIHKTGSWYVTKDIGYLDQYYTTLDPKLTALETITVLVNWNAAEIRRHLNNFLFRKTEEVNTKVLSLSGGEKARLSLSVIAAKTPRLLILDEVTNNLDLETRQHVIEVLKNYPGAMIVISHDEDFLREIGIEDSYEIEDGMVSFK